MRPVLCGGTGILGESLTSFWRRLAPAGAECILRETYGFRELSFLIASHLVASFDFLR